MARLLQIKRLLDSGCCAFSYVLRMPPLESDFAEVLNGAEPADLSPSSTSWIAVWDEEAALQSPSERQRHRGECRSLGHA
jgi:hypothetical protein